MKTHQWPGLKAIGKVERIRETTGKTTFEIAYYLLTIRRDGRCTCTPEVFVAMPHRRGTAVTDFWSGRSVARRADPASLRRSKTPKEKDGREQRCRRYLATQAEEARQGTP